MSIAALFALTLAAAAPPELPTPLSPEKLPAPAIPTAPATATATGGITVYFGPLSESVENCSRVAISALAVQDGFRYAEIGADGSVTGYTKTCRMAVVVSPGIEGSFFYVVTASITPDGVHAAKAIHERMQKSTHDPKTPKTLGTRDFEVEKSLVHVAWHLEPRPVSAMCKHFAGAAALTAEKRGYTIGPGGRDALLARIDGKQIVFLGMVGGVKDVSINFLVAGAGTDAANVARDTKALCTSITKLLFE